MKTSEITEITLRRFGETLLSCVLISALQMWFQTEGHLRETTAVNWVVALAGLGAFLVVDFVMLRRCRFVLGAGKKVYILSNIIAWVLFSVLHQTLLALCGRNSTICLYGFHLAKVGELAGMRARESAFLFDMILLVAVFVSQIGMKPILQEAEKELNARYE